MSVEAMLTRCLEIINRSGSYTTGTYARDAQGNKVSPTSPHARKFDAYGLLLHVAKKERFYSGTDEEIASNLLYEAAQEMGYVSGPRCSDIGGKPAVGAMYRRALAVVQREEAA